MSLKVAAAPAKLPVGEEVSVVVREYDEKRDKIAVEEIERQCEIGQLVVDLMGDPICRIRHFPLHVMLVAECGWKREIGGVIRACMKTVTRGNSSGEYVKLAYILGLRVSQTHRRLGIGKKLVDKIEEWCKENGADYAYMATDCTNQPSINLFTKKCCYTKFRTPTMLVQPVYAHYNKLSSGVAVLRLNPKLAESIYRRLFSAAEFFPKDIDTILSSKLNLGTFMAVHKNTLSKPDGDPNTGFLLPSSFAMLSVWNTKEVFKLEVKGVSKLKYGCCKGTRMLDSWLPWLRLPSFPDVFRKFGVHFLYGFHMEGGKGAELMRDLCHFAHNMGRDEGGCGAVVAEVGPRDPVRRVIPHWRKFSVTEDLWCIKKLSGKCGPSDDWMTSQSSSSPVIFVDPRDI